MAALFVSTMLVQGTALGGITMFDERILNELHITRSVLKFRDLIYIFTASFSCMFMARLCDRFGARTVVATGLVCFAAVMAGYAVATSIAMIYIAHALLGFCYACVHVVVMMVILSRWFPTDDPRRGIALGICVSGSSCGAIVTSQAITALLAELPWRGVFGVMALAPLVLLPLTLSIRTPRDTRMGRWQAAQTPQLGFSFRLLVSGRALAMMMAIVPAFYVSSCAASHTALMLRGQGLPLATAAGGVSLMFTAALVGKFGSGFLLIRFRLQTAWLLSLGLMTVGALLLVLFTREAAIFALFLSGLGWGGCFPLAQLKIGEIFPGDALTRVLGAFVVFESIGSAAGAWLTAVMYDASGSYTLPFTVNVVLLVAGLVASIMIHRNIAATLSTETV
ncbi:CynX/NimT family MFS transporter [Novosphingobium sp. BL-52-GroH]|uniref:MFS transporter n=1 Tax=Novosphingobium sp. BL-52-GroH TaxID=3349877 RepID=UPI00384E8053